MLCCFSYVRLSATLWTVVCQGLLSMGILQARILEWVAMPAPRGSSWPRHLTRVSYVSSIGRQILYHWCHLEAQNNVFCCQSLTLLSYSSRPHGLQHTRLPCPSASPRAGSNSCPLSQWCHPTILCSPIPFSCLQSFLASGSFLMSRLFESSGQSIGSFSFSISPPNEYSRLTGLISLQSKGLSRVFSNTTVQKHQLSGVQPSLWSSSHIHTWLLAKPWLWLDGPLLAK